ncbi:glutamate--cysteine ligase [Streptomyces sp. ODS28]|uniref:carboxylate-amine ligase n=1 Tax=Streptomyces sp. ODS28 TaxID=3136688 RepID=UPI0031E58E64
MADSTTGGTEPLGTDRIGHGGPTLGVEEEFLLADAVTRRPAAVAPAVVAEAQRLAGPGHVVAEMSRAQVETVSAVCADAAQLRAELQRLRSCAARAAREHGCVLVASGTAPLGEAGPPPVTDKPRYHRIADRYGALIHGMCANACHVHIGVPDVDEAVQVVNHLRPWTPLLLALTANSPYCQGRDTGHASWRTMLWDRWPTAAPPPYLRSAAHYRQLTEALVDSGAALDTGMVYWGVRPSRHVPTIEVRVADVMPGVEETVAFAALVRALVSAAVAEVRRGRRAVPVEDAVLRAALWRSAREGLQGQVLALPATAAPRLVPARHLADALAGLLDEQLTATGDDRRVRGWLRYLGEQGTGAARQRAAFHTARRLEDAVDALAVPVAHSPWEDTAVG